MNRGLFSIPVVVLALFASAGCSMGPHAVLVPAFTGIMPDMIAVMPVLNDTVDMKAPGVVRPLVERTVFDWGYDTVPPGVVDSVLAEHHIHEAGEINQFTPEELGMMFSADAILYTTITDWSTTWLAIYASQTVGLKFELKSAKNNQVLWEGQYTLEKRAVAGDRREIAALAVMSALSPYQPLAERTINIIFKKLPYGPHR